MALTACTSCRFQQVCKLLEQECVSTEQTTTGAALLRLFRGIALCPAMSLTARLFRIQARPSVALPLRKAHVVQRKYTPSDPTSASFTRIAINPLSRKLGV